MTAIVSAAWIPGYGTGPRLRVAAAAFMGVWVKALHMLGINAYASWISMLAV